MSVEHEENINAMRHYWDNAAATFDQEPDHGLRDPAVRAAWTALLVQWLPTPPATILDIGCGTGSISGVLAALGHVVTGIDLAPAMIAQAQAKAQAAGQQITFHVMEASNPQFAPQHFDAIVCRHLLWALPEPAVVLQRWIDLLTPGGRIVLIEGYWHTGGGLHAQQIVEALPTSLQGVVVHNLSDQTTLWGNPVQDERYVVVAHLPTELERNTNEN